MGCGCGRCFAACVFPGALSAQLGARGLWAPVLRVDPARLVGVGVGRKAWMLFHSHLLRSKNCEGQGKVPRGDPMLPGAGMDKVNSLIWRHTAAGDETQPPGWGILMAGLGSPSLVHS